MSPTREDEEMMDDRAEMSYWFNLNDMVLHFRLYGTGLVLEDIKALDKRIYESIFEYVLEYGAEESESAFYQDEVNRMLDEVGYE